MTILSGYMNPKLKNPAFDEGRLTDCNVVDSIDDLIVVDGDPLKTKPSKEQGSHQLVMKGNSKSTAVNQ